MRIWTAGYQLIPRQMGRITPDALSGRLTGVREGALLRVEFGSGAVGFADVHPWTSLGDDDLAHQLGGLRLGQLTPLTRRSLVLAQSDAVARSRGLSLFDNLPVPESHFLLSSFSSEALVDLVRAQDLGFRTVKIKIGHDLAAEAEWLVQNAPHFAGFRLRLDANAIPTFEALRDFLEILPSSLIKQIEFIEDPCVYHKSSWREIARRVPVALDGVRGVPPGEWRESGVSHLIIKPAVQDPSAQLALAIDQDLSVVVTSYLDHPVGQMGAALAAGHLNEQAGDRVEICGLLSQGAYGPNDFTRGWFEDAGPDFVPPIGSGLGFDSILENQAWRELR